MLAQLGETFGKAIEKIGESGEEFFKNKLTELDKPLNFDESGDTNADAKPEKVKEEYDDNGNLYKVNNELLPSNEYEVNGYKYETDDLGRIKNASGDLRLTETERKKIGDSMVKVGKNDAKDTDERGHLIADRFDGSNKLENLVPMDANLNRGEFETMENQWAKALKDGKEVHVSISPEYSGDSFRPDSFVVKYVIDGETSVKIFENKGAERNG